jgi:hypothetical protein
MKVLVVQRGHCFRKTGSTGTPGEQAQAVDVAAHIFSQKPSGWTVRIINADEEADRYRGDAFVALHCDGSSNPNVRGASFGYQTEAGRKLASAIKKAYSAVGFSGGFRADNYTANLAGYYGVRMARQVGNVRAVCFEQGFLSSPKDRDWLKSHQADIARAVWKGVQPLSFQPADYSATAKCDLYKRVTPRWPYPRFPIGGLVKKNQRVRVTGLYGEWRQVDGKGWTRESNLAE